MRVFIILACGLACLGGCKKKPTAASAGSGTEPGISMPSVSDVVPAMLTPAELIAEDSLRLTNELADAYESGAAPETIAAILKRREDNKARMSALNLSDDDKGKLLEKYWNRTEAASKRLSDAMMKKIQREGKK